MRAGLAALGLVLAASALVRKVLLANAPAGWATQPPDFIAAEPLAPAATDRP